jgi:hypothetical protein
MQGCLTHRQQRQNLGDSAAVCWLVDEGYVHNWDRKIGGLMAQEMEPATHVATL